ncbi:MAG TPA: hypothetical protein VHF88_03375 [Thermoleophilaceae bacterium]|nr:hypothetical protein [Thermoleophilaceae bacterium]
MAELPGPGQGGEEQVEPARSEAHERARKINPAYAEGELIKVGWAGNQAEAELIQGLLLENGIPSSLRRSMGFDVPDFLAAGPRDIYVPASGAEVARGLLDDTGMARPSERDEGGPRLGQALKIAAVLVLVGGGVVLLAWLLQPG